MSSKIRFHIEKQFLYFWNHFKCPIFYKGFSFCDLFHSIRNLTESLGLCKIRKNKIKLFSLILATFVHKQDFLVLHQNRPIERQKKEDRRARWQSL